MGPVGLLLIGVLSVSAVALPTTRAGAADDVVTNCSGNPSTAGSLPNEVANATTGDTITFDLSPSCSNITLGSRLNISGLTISGPGANVVTVNGDGTSGVLYDGGSQPTTVSGLTIAGGNDSSSGGGGIWNNGGELTVSEVVFSDNATSFFGGAISSSGPLTVTDSTFTGNSSNSEGYGAGAIMVDNGSTASISGSTFSGNTTIGESGGILNEGTLTVSNSTFVGNFTPNYGGAIGTTSLASTTTITNSTFSGNGAGYGGGGIWNNYGSTMSIGASILASASSGGDCGTNSSITDLGDNLADDHTCGFTAAGSLNNTASGLAPAGLADNGGPTQTIALDPGSAAIGGVTGPTLCPATDQRGAPRPATICDIGAFESTTATPTFNTTCIVPIVGTTEFPTVITGSIPSVIPNQSTFSVGAYQWGMTIPASITNDIDSVYGQGASVTSSFSTTVHATGTMQGSTTATLNFGPSLTPAVGNSFTMTGIATSAPTFTGTGAQVSVTPDLNVSAFNLEVAGNPYANFSCTLPSPAPVIASAAGAHDPIAFVTDPGPNLITPVDTATATPDTAFPFNTTEPNDIAITPNGQMAYVSGGFESTVVTPVNLSDDAVGSPITVGGDPEGVAITPDGKTVYVADTATDQVTPVNTTTNSAGSPIAVGDSPSAIAISPDGKTAYVANSGDGTVTPINTATNTAGLPIPVGGTLDAIAITPDGSAVYVVDSASGIVTPIDTSTAIAGASIRVGTDPTAIAITPDGSTAYVANSGDGTVTPIDISTGVPGSPITVGGNPASIAITPDGSTAYVANLADQVTPIDIATDTAGTPVDAGGDPLDLAITPDQAPEAALTVTPAPAGTATTFDASASAAPGSPIVNYAWTFGDGGTADTSVPTTTYTYAGAGTYTATVTETDAEGTSITRTFTGQTVSNNGGSRAEASSTFTVGVGTGYSCTVPGLSGTVDFPVVFSESQSPPTSVDVGGTFPTALGAQVTIPESVINHFISVGGTSLTIASQTTTEDGLTSVGGTPSGAVNPDTESAAANNLPKTDSPLVPNTSYTYGTSYNPVTWQAGPGTGEVVFVPGHISAEVTLVVHGTPTSESISCTPPSGVGSLGSTTVDPAPSHPVYQVPASTPPLQNQVSGGTDGGWGATVANTSKASVTGLSATVHVTDGGAPLTFDLAAMSASGTTCASSGSGSGSVTCSIGTLAAGTSDTLNLLVNTTGLANGITITGTGSVTSTNAGDASTSLGSIGVVVVAAGNGTKAVAAPGIPLASTKKTLKSAKAKVILTLPRKPTKKAVATPLNLPFASGSVIGNQPPVAVTLQSLAPSAEPALCPPTGTTKCEGDIVEAFGNFAPYTSNLTPITAVVQFFYGNSIPSGTIYFLKPNGKTVDKLALCKKTANGYDTPCLASAEQHLGTTGNLYAQDTVYFTGNDPVMGRR